LSDFGNHKYYIPGLHGNLIQVLNFRAAIATKTETSKFMVAREIKAGEKITMVNIVPTTVLKDSGTTEYLLSESVESNKHDESDTTSEVIGNNET